MTFKNTKWGYIALLTVLHSCSGIQVEKGPFNITGEPDLIKGKLEYLAKLQKSTTSDSVPNILLILADDLGKYDISTYNPEGVPTPAIDQLAAQGVRFNRGYSTCSVCSPSRASMLTGRYQQRYGYERQPMNRYAHNKLEYWFVGHMMNTWPMRLNGVMARPEPEEMERQGIPGSEILLSELLQQRGYQTAIFGKWHLGQSYEFLPTNRGFDEQYGFYEAFTLFAPEDDPDIVSYRHDYFANKHIWRQGREGSCAIRQNEKEIEESKYLTFAIADRVCDFLERKGDDPFFLYVPFSAPHTPFQAPRVYYDKFSHVHDENKRVYYAMIAALDDAVMQITDKLDALGLTDNTLIIFASDNGGATYTGATDNGPLNGGKFTQFEGGINIPMIISGPSLVPAGIDFDSPVTLMDIFTTAAAAAGCKMPNDRPLDGMDLTPYLNDAAMIPPARDLIWRTDYNHALVSGNWKYIWNSRDEQEYLFNLDADPGERENLAAAFPERAEAYKRRIMEWSADMKDPLWPGVMDYIFENDGEVTLWAI